MALCQGASRGDCGDAFFCSCQAYVGPLCCCCKEGTCCQLPERLKVEHCTVEFWRGSTEGMHVGACRPISKHEAQWVWGGHAGSFIADFAGELHLVPLTRASLIRPYLQVMLPRNQVFDTGHPGLSRIKGRPDQRRGLGQASASVYSGSWRVCVAASRTPRFIRDWPVYSLCE